MIPLLYSGAPPIHPYPTGEDLLDPGEPELRVWVPDRSILVLGYSQEADKELRLEAVTETGIPVYRRKGGGGAVLLTPGAVCVGMRLPRRPEKGLHDHFAFANGLLQKAFQDELGLELRPQGVSDLAYEGRKVMGSSLYLPRECALYLGSFLVSTPIALLDRFLAHPSREPEYRQGRSHGDFVRNLSEIPGLSFMTPAWLREMLETRLQAAGG
jgi:lipoate-protein ligase A